MQNSWIVVGLVAILKYANGYTTAGMIVTVGHQLVFKGRGTWPFSTCVFGINS